MSDVREIWAQRAIPVIYRPARGRLMIRAPYADNNREILRSEKPGSPEPEWNHERRYWLLPAARFTGLALRFLQQFGSVYVIQPHRAREACCRRCQDAERLECTCSCMGVNHGAGMAGGRWYEVSETCAVRWREAEIRWSLLTLPAGGLPARMFGG